MMSATCSNWAAPKLPIGVWAAIYGVKWWIAGAALGLTILSVRMWFTRDERSEWYGSTWGYALQVLPLLFGGVLVAGFLTALRDALVTSSTMSDVLSDEEPLEAMVAVPAHAHTAQRLLTLDAFAAAFISFLCSRTSRRVSGDVMSATDRCPS